VADKFGRKSHLIKSRFFVDTVVRSLTVTIMAFPNTNILIEVMDTRRGRRHLRFALVP
jgi:hypothetical protein